jgi:hypothetical protein
MNLGSYAVMAMIVIFVMYFGEQSLRDAVDEFRALLRDLRED